MQRHTYSPVSADSSSGCEVNRETDTLIFHNPEQKSEQLLWSAQRSWKNIHTPVLLLQIIWEEERETEGHKCS